VSTCFDSSLKSRFFSFFSIYLPLSLSFYFHNVFVNSTARNFCVLLLNHHSNSDFPLNIVCIISLILSQESAKKLLDSMPTYEEHIQVKITEIIEFRCRKSFPSEKAAHLLYFTDCTELIEVVFSARNILRLGISTRN
jgi:hypothetical protein